MDTPELSPSLLNAGRDYMASLDQLGLNVEGVMWVFDHTQDRFILWLIWSGVDRFGPFEIQQKLFSAYNAAALPAEITPFIVHVLSPRSSTVKAVVRLLKESGTEAFQFGEPSILSNDGIDVTFEGRPNWTYRLTKKNQTGLEQIKNWDRFSGAVLALAS